MTDKNSLTARFGPEQKRWIRTIDALMVLMAAVAIMVLLFLFPNHGDLPLLSGTAYAALVCLPIVAYSLYRQSDLSRLERVAILVLAICVCMALLIASVELNRAS